MALSDTTTPFLWGPNGEAKTPEEIARDREIAEALMRQGVDFSPIASPLQGLARVATAAAGAYRNYQADKAEGANSAANSSMLSNLLGGFGAPASGGSPPVAGGGLTPSDQPPQSIAGVGSPSGVLPASLTAALDKSEGGGDYDTLFSFANKNGPFAGTNVSQMTVGDVMAFTDPSGPYAQFVKKSIGRVATPVGRHQIVGTTLRNAVNEMGIDPSTPFNQGTQDAIAMHLARKRVQSSNTMSGKIAALRNEWEGFKSIPDAQLAQIVQDLEGGRPTQVASADASPWMMDAAPGTGLDDITAENGMQTLPFNPADAANYSVIPIPNATPQDAANYSVQPVKSDRLPNVFVGMPGDYADARVNQAFGTQPGADPQTTGAVPPAQPSVAMPYTQEPPAADPAMSSPLVRAILGAESPDALGPGPFPAAPGPMPQVAPPAAPTRRLPPSAMWRGADQDVAAMGGGPTAAPALQPSAFQAAPASAAGGRFPDAPQAQDGRMAAIIRAITDPSADAYTKRLGFAMLQNQMEAQSPAAQLEMQIKQAQLAKLQQRDRQSLVNAGEGQIYDPNSGQWISAPDTGKVDNQTFDNISGLRKEIQQLPSYKNLAQATPIYKSMFETAGRDTKASDLNLVYGLGKIMDPTSVVREGEIHMANDTQGMADYLNGLIAGIEGRGKLTPEGRVALMKEAFSRITAYKSVFDQDAEMYRGIVQRGNFNEADVIPGFGEFKEWQLPTPPAAADPYSRYNLERP